MSTVVHDAAAACSSDSDCQLHSAGMGGTTGCSWPEVAVQPVMTITSTFVEAERAFSAAGILCSKLRSLLDDSTIDTSCLL